jgi:uncharacterized membrane protein YdfJ with MMPL/SSD domain
LPVPFLRSVGYGGLLIPLVTVVVACTLLPVVLATVGPSLDRPRRRHSDRPSRLWTAWARVVVRHRWLALGTAVLVLAALLSPLHGLARPDLPTRDCWPLSRPASAMACWTQSKCWPRRVMPRSWRPA